MISNYAICRYTLAFIWFYHGLVPKLLGPHRDELAMNMSLGLSEASATRVSVVAGVLEIALAIALVVFWRQRWPLIFSAIAMPGLLAFVVVMQPDLLAGAFNPVTTNVAVLSLSVVALRLQPRSLK